ncbi:MAG: hypothetical protein AB1554_10290 [Chloroflexota bacterium]
MTRIHMDTEVVRETARLLDLTCGELYYMPPKLKNLAGSLSGAWQGGRSGHYARELRRMGEILQREVINLQRLAVRVGNEVEEWERNDASFKFQINAVAYETVFGFGPLFTENNLYPRGWLNSYRTQLKDIYNSEADVAWSSLGLVGVFIPTWAGGLVQVFADLGGGQNDYMMWAIQDWEKYDTFGQEIAASYFDSTFAAIKTSVLVSLDVVEIAIDTLDLVPGGYWVTTTVGLGFWSAGQAFSLAFDTALESDFATEAKDIFVNWFGGAINNAVQSVDSSFAPHINQILTADPGGHSGSW